MTGLDGLILIAFIVIATTFGKPVSYTSCPAIGSPEATVQAAKAQTASELSALLSSRSVDSATWMFGEWAKATKSNCYQTKAVWGLTIALCLLFASSMFLLPSLWFKNKKARSVKTVDGA